MWVVVYVVTFSAGKHCVAFVPMLSMYGFLVILYSE